MAEKLIAGGAWIQVKVDIDGELKAIGMANSASYDESFQVQGAQVIGHLGPLTYDSQGYSCSINLATFVPERVQTLYKDGGEITINDILPTRDQIQADGKGKQFDRLVFVNKATNEVLNSFEEVIIDGNGAQINPNTYVTNNLRMLSVKRTK